MSSFVKLAAVFSAGLLAVAAAADKPADDKSKKPDAKASGDKKSKKDKKEKPPVDPNAPPRPLQLPIPNGHDARVLVIPDRDSEGKLKMRYNIGLATKVDDEHVDMDDLRIETFNNEGAQEMTIDLPTATLNLTTSVITAQKRSTIKR